MQSLESKGYITETTELEKRDDQRIRTYALTAKGNDIVPKITSRILKLVSFVDECCPEGAKVIIMKKEDLESGF